MKHPIIIISLAAILSIGTAFAVQTSKSKSKLEAATVQPLTYANVVSQFKAAHLRATELQNAARSFSRAANGGTPTFITTASSSWKIPMKMCK
jgi:hypothetical protein